MAFCPECNVELQANAVVCHKCGYEINVDVDVDDDNDELIVIGTIDDKITAEMAREILASHGIRAGVFSNSGFFGSAGLTLTPIFSTNTPQFEVSVEAKSGEEAAELLEMTVGDNFHRRDN